MAKKTPNYGLRRGVAASIGTGIASGIAGAASAAVDPVRRLNEAGLDVTTDLVRDHIVGSGVMGAVGGAAAMGLYMGGKGIVNKMKNRNLGRQFDK